MKVVNTAGQILQQGGGAGGGTTFTAGMSTLGNTVGTTGLATDRLVLAGINGITLSGSTNAGSMTITISGVTTAAQTNQSAIRALGVSNTGNTAGNTGVSTGIDWVIAGTNMISASESTAGGGPNTIWLNATQSVQTQGITGDQLSIGVSTGGNTLGNTTVNSGTRIVFVGTNLTLSQGTAAGATTISISGPLQGTSITGNASITYDSAGIKFNGSNLAGVGTTITGNASITLDSAGLKFNGSNLAGVGTSITGNASITLDSAGLKFNGSNLAGVGTSITGNASITANSAGLQFNGSNLAGVGTTITGRASITMNSAGIQFNGSNMAGVSTGFTGANISGSFTHDSSGLAISLSVAAPGAAAENNAINLLGANTAGNTTATGSTIGWSGINLTFSGTNNSQIVVSAPPMDSIGVSNLGNTAGTTTIVDQRMVLVGSNNITLSQSADAGNHSGTVTILGASLYTNSIFEPFEWNVANTGTSTYGLGTLGLRPFTLHNYLSFTQLNMIGSAALSGTFGGSANTFTVSIGGASSFGFSATASITNSNILSYALFSRGSGNFSDMLFTLSTSSASIATAFVNVINLSVTGVAGGTVSASAKSSMSVSVSWPTMTSVQSINGASSWTIWGPGYINSNSSTTASAGQSTSTGATTSVSIGSAFPGNLSSFWQSNKIIALPFAGSLTPGEYWLGIWRGSSSSSTLSTQNANVGANNSYTSSVNWSAGTSTAQITWAGHTASIVNSLGFLGAASQATMAPSPGHGSFSATYATNTTYRNAAGEPVGAICLSNINTGVSFFRSWFQLANDRI